MVGDNHKLQVGDSNYLLQFHFEVAREHWQAIMSYCILVYNRSRFNQCGYASSLSSFSNWNIVSLAEWIHHLELLYDLARYLVRIRRIIFTSLCGHSYGILHA